MNFIDKIKNLFNRNKTKALPEPENNDYNYTFSDDSNQTNNSWVLGNNGNYQEPFTKFDNEIITFLNNYYQKVSQLNPYEPVNNYKIAYSSVVQSDEFVTQEEYNYNYTKENQLLNNMKRENKYIATEENGFYHVQSQGYQMPNFQDMTRVYVNCKNGNISDVAQMLAEYNTNPNFYMKFVSNEANAQEPRNEKIVIYCNKNELDYTLGLVQNCKNLNPKCFEGSQALLFLKNEQGIATVANQPETDQYKNLYGQTKKIPQSVFSICF